MKLQIDYDENVITHNNNALKLKLKTDASQHASVHPDGLYAESKTSGGTRYPDGYQSTNGLYIGVEKPGSATIASKRACASYVTHRVFTCTQTDGSDINTRGGLDLICPGDMYRVYYPPGEYGVGSYKYYLITKVSPLTGVFVAEIDDQNVN